MYIPLSDFSFIERLETEKEDFTLIVTNYTTRVKTRFGKYIYSEEKLSKWDLSFMSNVKTCVEKNKHLAAKNEKGINYFFYSETPKDFIKKNKKLFEIDLRSAYWKAALNLGFLSEEIYNSYLKREAEIIQDIKNNKADKEDLEHLKLVRLKALGAIAVRKEIYEYKKGEQVSNRTEQDEDLLWCWINICTLVSDLMNDAVGLSVSDNDFLFFWVDAIFTTEKGKNKVCEIFEKSGFEYKIKEIEEIRYSTSQRVPVLTIYEKDGKEMGKPFPVLKNKLKFFKSGK